MFASKKSSFGSFYSMKTTYFAFFVLFLKKYDFHLKNSLRIRFWFDKKTTRQISSLKKYNASYFEFKKNTKRQI